MSDNHYDTPESIFSIPDDVGTIQKADLISHTIARMIGTIQTVAAAVEAMAVSLETAKEYGLSAYFYESGGYYKITRYGQEVTECRDILELSDTTLAIANFIDVGKEHHKIA